MRPTGLSELSGVALAKIRCEKADEEAEENTPMKQREREKESLKIYRWKGLRIIMQSSLPGGRINSAYVSFDRCLPNCFLKVSKDDEFITSPDVILQC